MRLSLVVVLSLWALAACAAETDFETAIERHDLIAIREHLQHGADPNALSSHNLTPLYRIIMITYGNPLGDDEEIVRLLIKAGAQVNRRQYDHSGDMPLHLAVLRRPNLVQVLIEAGADVDARGDHDQRPLHVAAANWESHEMLIEKLVAAGADVNATDAEGITPLMVAAKNRLIGAVRSLLVHGARPDLADRNGKTAAEYATDERDVHSRTLIEQTTALTPAMRRLTEELLAAARADDRALVESILGHGADPSARIAGESAMVIAASKGYLELVRLLLQRGASAEGALVAAAGQRQWATYDVIAGRADLQKVSAASLFVAGDEQRLLKVLDMGVDPNTHNDSTSLLAQAVEASCLACVELLLARGADPGLPNAFFETPRSRAHVPAIRDALERAIGGDERNTFDALRPILERYAGAAGCIRFRDRELPRARRHALRLQPCGSWVAVRLDLEWLAPGRAIVFTSEFDSGKSGHLVERREGKWVVVEQRALAIY